LRHGKGDPKVKNLVESGVTPALFALLGRDEDVLVRELLEERRRLAEVRGQHVRRFPGDPLREVDRLVNAAVERDQAA
jgi:hypothetical protein